jgi:DNA-directed RNA polymerase specialized sigma24 family protein
MRSLLSELPPTYRAAIVLRYWYDMPYLEIAETLETTVSAVKGLLFRARRTLAEMIPAGADVDSSYGGGMMAFNNHPEMSELMLAGTTCT